VLLPDNLSAVPEVLFIVPEERLDEYLGVGYLAASLSVQGISSLTLQGNPENLEPALRELFRRPDRPFIVAIACIYLFSVVRVNRLASWIREWSANTVIVVGGHAGTFEYVRILHEIPEVDYVICGEGDESFVELIKVLRAGKQIGHIAGLAWRENSVSVRVIPGRNVADLDALPFPSRDTLRDVVQHRGSSEGVLARLSGSRGCYGQCEFCSIVSFYSLDGQPMRWRPRSPERIAQEVEWVVRNFGVRAFWFVDDEFIGPPRSGISRVMELADLLRPMSIEFGFDARANGVTAFSSDELDRLRDAGLRVVSIGVESGSQKVLRRIRKGINVESNWEAIRRLRSAGIGYRFGFIMYDRLTCPTDLQANLEFLRFAGPHRICNSGPFRLLNVEFPVVGSPLHHELALTGHSVQESSRSDMPRISEKEIGYTFKDPRVALYRLQMHRLASEAVETEMIARQDDGKSPDGDLWFGVNMLPRNIAVMDAFLFCHEWLFDRIGEPELATQNTYRMLLGVFDEELLNRGVTPWRKLLARRKRV